MAVPIIRRVWQYTRRRTKKILLVRWGGKKSGVSLRFLMGKVSGFHSVHTGFQSTYTGAQDCGTGGLKEVICCLRDDIKQTHCTSRPMVERVQSLVPPRSACGRSGEVDQTGICGGRPSAPHIPQRVTRARRLGHLNPTVRDCIQVTSSEIRNATVACV